MELSTASYSCRKIRVCLQQQLAEKPTRERNMLSSGSLSSSLSASAWVTQKCAEHPSRYTQVYRLPFQVAATWTAPCQGNEQAGQLTASIPCCFVRAAGRPEKKLVLLHPFPDSGGHAAKTRPARPPAVPARSLQAAFGEPHYEPFCQQPRSPPLTALLRSRARKTGCPQTHP